MSAPLSGTKTRVVGFLKGLFGKGNADAEAARDEAVYDYHQELPVTGAQLKAPAPAAVPGASTAKSTAAQAMPKNGNGHPANVPAAVTQPTARQNGNVNGFTISSQSSGHINGVVLGQTPSPATPATPGTIAPTAPIPVAIKLSNGNSTHAPAAPVAPAPEAVPATVATSVNLPLAAVVAALPSDLQTRLVKKDFRDSLVAVPMETVLSQLPTGMVKIPFAVVRESAPHLFSQATDADQTMVTLPLAEVLRRVNPAQFAKPENQVRITADADVTSPFADKGKNAGLEVKSSAPTRSLTPDPTPSAAPRQNLSGVSKPTAPTANVPPPVRINQPTPPPSKPPTPAPSVAQAAPPAPTAPISLPKVQPPTQKQAPTHGTPASPKAPPTSPAPIPMPTAQAPASTPAPAAAPAPKINGVASLRMVSAPAEPPVAAQTVTPVSAPVAKAPIHQATLTVALKSLVDAWPDAVKKEILDHNLLNGSVELPLDTVAEQLKNGRVAFPWGQIRGWISPRPGTESSHGTVEVELPLKVMAPLFLGLKATDSSRAQRLTADDRIPDVFAPSSKPATPAPAQPVSPAPVAASPTPVPAAMTPDAVVKRAAALQGVAGALVALPDGLVVASKLPAGLSADSLAGFLPQIYAKFDACLKDLHMDGLNNLNFTAGTVPWRVFRTDSVYFAVFGHANQPLPADWLATLASELGKKQG